MLQPLNFEEIGQTKNFKNILDNVVQFRNTVRQQAKIENNEEVSNFIDLFYQMLLISEVMLKLMVFLKYFNMVFCLLQCTIVFCCHDNLNGWYHKQNYISTLFKLI